LAFIGSPPQDFRCEVRNPEKSDVLAFRQRIADSKSAVIGDTDHVAGISFFGQRTVLCKEELGGR